MNELYLLVTPVRNEEDYLLKVLNVVKKQTLRPDLWIIVYDESEDDSEEIIVDLCKKNNWIRSIKDERNKSYWLGYGESVRLGFDYAIKLAAEEDIKYSYLGLLDVDAKLEQNYFEILINHFEKNNDVGIISGYQYNLKADSILFNTINEQSEGCAGPARLYRKNTLIDINGFPATPSPDTVSDTKARLHGWGVKVVKDTSFFHIREGLVERDLKGKIKLGESRYMLNLHPVNALLTSIYFSFRKPYLGGILFLYGYLAPYILGREKIKDQEIKDYFWHSSFNLLRKKANLKIKSLFRI